MGIVSIAGIGEDVVVKIGSLTVPADFHVIRSTRHSKGDSKKPPALNKKFAHQVQLSKEDKDERKQSEEAKGRLKKGKGLRSSPPHVRKKKKDPTKKKGQWRGRTLLMARPHDLKFPKSIITGATALPHHLNGAPARLARQRGEYDHIRPKLHKCVACSRPLLGERA
ncbi:hypothetical protein PIB30_031205 [Stylosanthes scabra]|uniref:Uncharacterized protein n=1 Tax=Stylosanthes scabra TaxID=79078 RepID=A0ABU6SBX5_9FABA|nr:hypothetical protein [Stylosanthes scabra]